MKSLDKKLAYIHADPHGARDFILADAKDADMAAGLAAPGKDARTGKTRSLAEYRDQMREVTKQGLVDIMLMSCSTSEAPTTRPTSTSRPAASTRRSPRAPSAPAPSTRSRAAG